MRMVYALHIVELRKRLCDKWRGRWAERPPLTREAWMLFRLNHKMVRLTANLRQVLMSTLAGSRIRWHEMLRNVEGHGCDSPSRELKGSGIFRSALLGPATGAGLVTFSGVAGTSPGHHALVPCHRIARRNRNLSVLSKIQYHQAERCLPGHDPSPGSRL